MDAAGAKPFKIKPAGIGNVEMNGVGLGTAIRGGGGTGASARVAVEVISKGDVVEMVGYSHVQRCRANTSSQIVGVAAFDCAINDVCVFVTQQDNTPNLLIHNKTSGGGSVTINDNSLIKPDPVNLGGVIPATSLNDPIIGRVTNGGFNIGPGASGQAQILV
jgi:hypothetical protein